MIFDSDRFWQAIEAEDPRFDGWVFCGVKTTGIYCRPSCPARTPKRENVRFFATAAAAQAAGFRACKRCRPDATPGSPDWDLRADLVGRAMRLIADGVVDREGVGGLAGRLGYTERHVHRQLMATVGAGPLALARAQRAQTARILLETTVVPITGVAFAAGFQSVRQFNATVREVFALAPRELRARARRGDRSLQSGALSLRLPYRSPLDGDGLIAFLGLRAVPGIEEVHDGAYRRSLRLPQGSGVVELRPADGYVHAKYWLEDLRDLAAAMQRSRALLDLDSDPLSVVDALGEDALLGPLVRGAPGRRVAGHVDGHELAVRAVLGQQVSIGGARTLAGRLVGEYGQPLERPLGGVTHTFPSIQALAAADPERLAMPTARRRALLGLARALADGDLTLDAGSDRGEARRRLLELPGIGPWTTEYIAMRAMRDPDAFLPSDLGVRHALEQLGGDGRPAAAEKLAERWRPYRAYALQHLWATLSPARQKTHRKAINPMPNSTKQILYTTMESPIGELLLAGDGETLSGLYMQAGRKPGTIATGWEPSTEPFADVKTQLQEYFAGDRTAFDVPLAAEGAPFEREVWHALEEIPYGETVSYGEIARRVGQPTAARAVGTANGRNPIAVIVPCHRVIGADGSLTGYGGGLERKRLLLELERGQGRLQP